MVVYIVLVNGHVDEVFLTREAAEANRKNRAMTWNITAILEKTVYEF